MSLWTCGITNLQIDVYSARFRTASVDGAVPAGTIHLADGTFPD